MRFQLDQAADVTAELAINVRVYPAWVVNTIAWMLSEHQQPTEASIEDSVKLLLHNKGIEHMLRFPQGWNKKVKDDHIKEALLIFQKVWPGVPVEHRGYIG